MAIEAPPRPPARGVAARRGSAELGRHSPGTAGRGRTAADADAPSGPPGTI